MRPKERDRLAIHYHQSNQVRHFRTLVPSFLLDRSPTERPILHLFDEPQFNTQDGYIGFMLDFFRRLRGEGKLVFICLHPTARHHLEILREVGESFLLVHGGTVEQKPSFADLVGDAHVRAYVGREMTAIGDALAGQATAFLMDDVTLDPRRRACPPCQPDPAARRGSA